MELSDLPQVRSYQELQDWNVLEKDRLLKSLMKDQEVDKPAVAKPKTRKRKVASPPVSIYPRKSLRLREKPGPAPTYHEEEEEARGRSRKVASGGARARSRHQLRPRRQFTYVEEELEPLDNVIHCTPCGEPRSGGCHLHPPVFKDLGDYNLKVEKSYLKDAGDGVVNRGSTIIPEGILFGPYPGKFFSVKEHKKVPESGMAWRITNPEGPGVLGFVDPGSEFTGQKFWMAKVNCTGDAASQNLVGFQFQKKIYYRVIKPIPAGVELLVYYGDQYARSLGIKVDQLDLYKGKEDHTTKGARCGHCQTLFATEEYLNHHFSMNGGGSNACLASLVKKKKAGTEKKFSCGQCGKNFTSKGSLTHHLNTIHGNVTFCCSHPGCGLSFSKKSNLARHVATVHEEKKAFKCGHCGLCFGEKSKLTRHVESVHEKIRHSCPECPATFTTKCDVKFHLATVHGGKKRIRSKEKKHLCTTCQEDGVDQKFRHPNELKAHIKKFHVAVYQAQVEKFNADHPHLCSLPKCKKRFGTKVERSRHEKCLHEV